MMNQTQFTVWAKTALMTNSIEFVDEEGEVTKFEVGGDEADLAENVFGVDTCQLWVTKDGEPSGAIGIINEFDTKQNCTVADAYTYTEAAEHLMKDWHSED